MPFRTIPPAPAPSAAGFRRVIKRPVALTVLTLLLPVGAVRAGAVLVEDFESPDTANFATYNAGELLVTATNTWSVTSTGIDLYEAAARAEAAAFDGAQAVDLAGSPGAGVIETTFPTVVGQSYELVFHYARNALLGLLTGDALVEVVGGSTLLQAQVQHDPALHAFDAYLQFRGSFTADVTVTTLRFTSLNPDNTGITLDGISIATTTAVGAGTEVEPSTWGRLKGRFRD
ncbi:MAG TPA: hypothetical protein VKU85_07200 [bacterium]|nr:hypothetical protein [bacterium]